MFVKAHTSIIGETGYNCHSRNFFKALQNLTPVQVRNFTVPSYWNGYFGDECFNQEYYIDDQLKTMLVEQTLHTDAGLKEFPLYKKWKNDGIPDVHIVLNETNHHYFYDNYDGLKIAYNVWETTKQPDDFFNRLKSFDQVWVPSEWQRQCTIEQGISADKVKVVPEGVDTQMYKPINRVVSKPLDRPFRFVLVGRWDYRKSTLEIIKTFTETFSKNENVELVISVDNPFASDGLETTEKRLEHFGILHSNIKIVHHLSKEDYIQLLKGADAFLSCARSEGWNLPLIEAMACGVPSIYSNWGGQLEFAKGKGIPVQIIGEVSAGIQQDEYYSWTKGAPGNFAEPDFTDLSRKMKDVVQNYTIHKKKALDDSDEIREIFTWENAAKKANQILQELISNEHQDYNDSVAIILAHANTLDRQDLLKECISLIKMDTILSTNYPVDVETQQLATWTISSKENPILLKEDFQKYNVDYYMWYTDEYGNKKTTPFEYEHGYAAYDLTKNGIKWAKSIGKKKVHIINYDYLIPNTILKENDSLLDTNDIVLYKHEEWNFGKPAYCSAFFSSKIETAENYFTKYNSKEEYYKSMTGFNILELNMSSHFDGDTSIVKSIKSMSNLSQEVKTNLKSADNNHHPYASNLKSQSFKEISDFYDCDKTTYHEYHKYYPMFFEKWRNDNVNIFEIGIEYGKSVNIWKRYFPHAKIWGMDISSEYRDPDCQIFKGDQSKLNDLTHIVKKTPKCKIIVDDGSHVPEHQLKTFYFFFEKMLDWGGVYIIEDIECSYWHPIADVYGYETGHLNLIEYFTKLNHEVNSHYNKLENKLHIKSITYGANCVIIQKKEADEIVEKKYRFEGKLIAPIVKENEITHRDSGNNISINFVDGPFVEITGGVKKKYTVKFIDDVTNNLVYSVDLENNQWARCSRQWFTKWRIEVTERNLLIFEHTCNLENQRVFISLESSSLGDTLAWVPYAEEFRKKHGCHVIISTFHNDLFKSEYPQLEFISPGSIVNNLYALYRLGCFYNDAGVDFTKHKTDFRHLPLQAYASDILGLEFEEIKPRIKPIQPMQSEKPYICIANHSTAQSKYWNNPTGWQELVDYVKSLDYDVYLLSREEDGFMGNKNPKGVIKVDGKSLEEIGSILLGSSGFVGLGSGLTWFAWGLNVPTILISGFSETYQEMDSVYRIINENVCHGCFARHLFDKGDWNWCPDYKGTERQFECSKSITFEMVKPKLDELLGRAYL